MQMNINSPVQAKLAIAGILFSATLWGIIWYPMRLFEQAGLPAVWTTLLMYLAAAIVSLPLALRQRGWRDLPLDLLWLALAAGVTNLAVLTALIEGEVMRVMLLFFLSPLWSVLIARWWLGERLSPAAWAMLLLAMSGTVTMLWRTDLGAPWPHGPADWLALFAGVMFSVNNVLSRKLAQVSMVLKTTVVFWGVVLVSLTVILLTNPQLPDVSINVWLAAPVIGGGFIITMTVSVLYGLARMPVYRAAVLTLFQIVVAAVSAWLLSDEVMTLPEWLGGALIVTAAYGVARLEKYR